MDLKDVFNNWLDDYKFIVVENFKCSKCEHREYAVLGIDDEIYIICDKCGHKYDGKYEIK